MHMSGTVGLILPMKNMRTTHHILPGTVPMATGWVHTPWRQQHSYISHHFWIDVLDVQTRSFTPNYTMHIKARYLTSQMSTCLFEFVILMCVCVCVCFRTTMVTPTMWTDAVILNPSQAILITRTTPTLSLWPMRRRERIHVIHCLSFHSQVLPSKKTQTHMHMKNHPPTHTQHMNSTHTQTHTHTHVCTLTHTYTHTNTQTASYRYL